jgi:hypothetical protein
LQTTFTIVQKNSRPNYPMTCDPTAPDRPFRARRRVPRPTEGRASERRDRHWRVRRDRVDKTGRITCATTGACSTSASAANTPEPAS